VDLFAQAIDDALHLHRHAGQPFDVDTHAARFHTPEQRQQRCVDGIVELGQPLLLQTAAQPPGQDKDDVGSRRHPLGRLLDGCRRGLTGLGVGRRQVPTEDLTGQRLERVRRASGIEQECRDHRVQRPALHRQGVTGEQVEHLLLVVRDLGHCRILENRAEDLADRLEGQLVRRAEIVVPERDVDRLPFGGSDGSCRPAAAAARARRAYDSSSAPGSWSFPRPPPPSPSRRRAR
jgi:hypothetical protein